MTLTGAIWQADSGRYGVVCRLPRWRHTAERAAIIAAAAAAAHDPNECEHLEWIGNWALGARPFDCVAPTNKLAKFNDIVRDDNKHI